MPNISIAMPEIFLLLMACITIFTDLFTTKSKKFLTFWTVQFALIGTIAILLMHYQLPTSYTFNNMYIHDKIGSFLKIFICIISIFAFHYARAYLQDRNIPEGEYYILGLFSVLGMLVLVSANSLLILFLGLETLSLPLYAMVAINRESSMASEAAMKYYIMGAVATGLFLYGLSIIYGVTNSLDIPTITNVITQLSAKTAVVAVFAMVFVVAGIAFKLGAAPFHVWAPDVYQGAPTPVTLFIGSAPKIAAFALAIRFLTQAMPHLQLQWEHLFIVIAVLSIALGNIVAIVQTNIKRMLAYSSIAHMGYMSLGILVGTQNGYAASMFYMVMYALMTAGAFAVITFISSNGHEAENLSDLRGLNTRNPWLAFMMLLLMFSMAGIPPTVGFFAKLGVLEVLVKNNLVWLAAYALVFAVIGAYYYLAIVKVMYFEEPHDATPFQANTQLQVAIMINSIAIVILGLFPSTLINICRNAFGV